MFGGGFDVVFGVVDSGFDVGRGISIGGIVGDFVISEEVDYVVVFV